MECDVLICGGGMAGCGAAYEAAYWAKSKGLRVVLVEKAAIERSGAVAMGLSAINCYMGMKWGENTTLREYIARDFLILYGARGRTVYLLSIKHHRQLSFDFPAHWR